MGTAPHEQSWSECRVEDLSALGAGLLIGNVSFADINGMSLTVRVTAPTGGSVFVDFVGVVRNVTVVPGRGVRIGIEFTGMSDMEQSIVNALELMEAVW